MEVMNGGINIHKDVVLNGYMNKSFQACPKDKNTDIMAICEFDHCDSGGHTTQLQMDDTTGRYEKKGKGTRIWSFVSRRRANSGRTKRPQSMILSGEIPESKPKLSFMDKVRSFKRLRSSTFSKGSVFRNSKTKVQSLPTEDIKVDVVPNALFRTRKFADGQRPYRHSYAGYIDDLDTSFEDVELNICISECDSNENRWLRDIAAGINGDSEIMDSPSMSNHRRHALSTKSSTIAEGEIQRRGLKIPPEHRRGRSSYMWSYLKGISLNSKDNSKGLDKIQGNFFQNVEIMTDNSSSAGSDRRLEDNAENGNTSDSASATKPKSFGGVFRFFSNVAEAARKWRGSTRSSTMEDQVSQSTPRTPRLQISTNKEPLVIENENALTFPSEHQKSSDLEIWNNHVQSSTPVEDISPDQPTQIEPNDSMSVHGQIMEDNTSCCIEEASFIKEVPTENTEPSALFTKLEEHSNFVTDSSNMCLDTVEESKVDSVLDPNPDSTFITEPRFLEGEDEDVFEYSDSAAECHVSLSTTASSCEEEQWEDGQLDVTREEEEEAKVQFGSQSSGLAQEQVPDHMKPNPEDDVHPAGEQDEGRNEAMGNDCSIASDSDTDQNSEGSENSMPLPPLCVSRNRNPRQPLRVLTAQLSVAPPLKLPLDRCMSLPLSQSTPSGLDQVGWMKRKLVSTGEADLGSRTLEVHRGSSKGRIRWKALKPGSHQLPVHKSSSSQLQIQSFDQKEVLQ
ncbi:uncharacterized protein WCC33_015819 [Rhinophrynus dorsalis]